MLAVANSSDGLPNGMMLGCKSVSLSGVTRKRSIQHPISRSVDPVNLEPIKVTNIDHFPRESDTKVSPHWHPTSVVVMTPAN